MATKPLKTIKFPGLPDTYTIPQIDDTLSNSGEAADAKAVGVALSLFSDYSESLLMYQYSDNRVATPIFANLDAKTILKKCWLADENKYECILIGYANKEYTPTDASIITEWGVSRQNAVAAIESATFNYLWFYIRAKDNSNINASDIYFGMQYNLIANHIADNNQISDYAYVRLANYSASRLMTPIFTTATDKETIAKCWLSDDEHYECILIGNLEKSMSDVTARQLVAWGGSYSTVSDAISNCSVPYFYLFFRNKINTSATINPSEVQFALYNTTDLQKAVIDLDKRTSNELKGKTFAVLCDSIGTHGNSGKWCNVPELIVTAEDVGHELSAYVTYYDLYTNINHNTGTGTFTGLTIGGISLDDDDIGTEITFTPTADDVGKSLGNVFDWNGNDLPVWWTLLAEHYEMTPIPVCWASSSYSSHENSTPRLTAAYAWHPSQIRKAGIRTAGSMTRTAPDYVILARGCNDMTHSPYDKLTSDFFGNVDWDFPANDQVSGGYGLKEAVSKTIQGIWTAYPNSKIILCTIPYVGRIDYDNFPTNNDDTSYPQWNDAIRECADFFGCGLIDFSKDGITHANLTTFAPDMTHPNAAGHALMGKQAIKDMALYK